MTLPSAPSHAILATEKARIAHRKAISIWRISLHTGTISNDREAWSDVESTWVEVVRCMRNEVLEALQA